MQRPLELLALLLLLLLAGCGHGGGGGVQFVLAFAAVPVNGTDGRTLSNVVVEVRNGAGAVETTASPDVTVSLASGGGATVLGGTVTVAAVAGVATFSALTTTGTSNEIRLVASAPASAPVTSGPFPVLANATQLVITSAVPSTIAPLQSFDVTVELRTGTGAVATQLTDAVTLALDTLPDLLWHASGNGTRVTELVEVTTAATVVATLPSPISGEIYGASWNDSFDSLVITDIFNHLGLANPTTGDEVRFRDAPTLVASLRTVVVDAGVGYAGDPGTDDRYTIDLISGISTLVGDWTFNPAAFTPNGVLGFAKHPTNGGIFGIAKTTASTSDRRLVTADLTAGTFTDVGGLGDKFACLAFNASGVLYGVTGDGATTPETLFTIDPATAAKALIGALGNGLDGEVIALVPRRLRGATTVDAVAGVATFTDVWFEQIGSNCTLKATTSALASASSTAVQVTGSVTAGASVQFDAAASTVAEDVAGGVAQVTVSLSAAVDYALPVMFFVGNGSTATIGGDTPDATIAGAFQLTFAPGETTKTISIPIVDDATAEVDETLIITIASARLATSIGANATHTLTITSNE